MENENEYAQEEIVEQEEQISEELEDNQEDTSNEDNQDDDKVTLTKAEFNKINRQAIAYQANKGKPEKTLTKPNQETATISPDRLDRIELMQEGYSREEVDTIMELGGRKMLDNPIVKGAIQVIRQQEKSKNASESLASKSPVFKKYTSEDLSKMSSADMEKVLRG